MTEGLGGLPQRLSEYARMGARFAKWRAVFTIGETTPSRACVEANAQALARYAALCQETGLVPIVEPEVLMAGEHTLARCGQVTEDVLHEVFAQLQASMTPGAGLTRLTPSGCRSGSMVVGASTPCWASRPVPSTPSIVSSSTSTTPRTQSGGAPPRGEKCSILIKQGLELNQLIKLNRSRLHARNHSRGSQPWPPPDWGRSQQRYQHPDPGSAPGLNRSTSS